MAKSKLSPNRKKYYHNTKKEWLFDKKSKTLLIISAIILSIVAILGLVGAIMKYYRIVSN